MQKSLLKWRHALPGVTLSSIDRAARRILHPEINSVQYSTPSAPRTKFYRREIRYRIGLCALRVRTCHIAKFRSNQSIVKGQLRFQGISGPIRINKIKSLPAAQQTTCRVSLYRLILFILLFIFISKGTG